MSKLPVFSKPPQRIVDDPSGSPRIYGPIPQRSFGVAPREFGELIFSGIHKRHQGGVDSGQGGDIPVVDPLLGLAWSAGITEYWRSGDMLSDDDFEVKYIIDGVDTTSPITPAGLLLPDFEGVYYALPAANDLPVYGARWDNGIPYANTAAGSNAPLPEMPHLFAQPAYTNGFHSSSDMANGYWGGIAPAAQNGVGITGVPNTATTLSSTGTWQHRSINFPDPNIAVVGAGYVATTRTFISKDSPGTRVDIQANFNSDPDDRVGIDISTGAVLSPPTTALYSIHEEGNFWVITCQVTAIADTSTYMTYRVYAALSVETGDVVVGQNEYHGARTLAEVEHSAPIITEGSTVTSPAVRLPYDDANHANDQGMYYCEYTLLGTGEGSQGVVVTGNFGRILTVSTNGDPANVSSTDSSGTQLNRFSAVEQVTTYKMAMIYDASELLRTLDIDGLATEAAYSGEWQQDGGLSLLGHDSVTSAAGSLPALIRNVTRWDLPYADAKAKAAELMLNHVTYKGIKLTHNAIGVTYD